MILILQIAAGIVLGFLILQNLPRILHALRRAGRIALIFGTVAAVIGLGLLLEQGMGGRGSTVALLVGLALLIAFVYYTGSGLGYLYLGQRARVARSRRWSNFLRLLGVHPSWHTSTQPRRHIADKVGGVLFMGIGLFLFFYVVATGVVAFILILATGAYPLDQQKPSVIAAVWGTAAAIPGVLIFLWISRRPRRTTAPRDNEHPTA